MFGEEIIENSELNVNDKIILKNIIANKKYPCDVFNLSIFSKIGKYNCNDEYEYHEYTEGTFYYIKTMNIYIDKEFKLIPYVNWWYETDLKRFIQHVDMYLKIIKNLNISDVKETFNNFMGITKWFNTYGHFLDEVFSLKHFMLLRNGNNDFKPFFSFPMQTNMYGNSNYKQICELLFDDYINVYECDNVVQINNFIVIKHFYCDKTFHLFSLSVSNIITDKIITKNNKIPQKILFITRGDNDPPHLPRNLKNKKDIEKTLSDNNVEIFNPETHDFYELVNKIQNYDNIIITWGSALTNLCFSKEKSKIIILKSKSYEHEKINLFEKIINARSLSVTIIESICNEIEPAKILNCFQ